LDLLLAFVLFRSLFGLAERGLSGQTPNKNSEGEKSEAIKETRRVSLMFASAATTENVFVDARGPRDERRREPGLGEEKSQVSNHVLILFTLLR
jgi:hypothetical protein